MFPNIDKRSDKKEILDDFDCDFPSLKANLLDIAMFNYLLKTRDAILAYVKMVIETKKLTGEIKILDLCAGSADISIHIINWARKNNKNIKIDAIDIVENIIKVAKDETKSYPEITPLVLDAFNLPYEKESFDIIICSQAFHHFTDENCIRLLRITYNLCSHVVIINDLKRAWINYWGAYLLSYSLNMGYMTKNDAPLSVLRGFTKKELIDLAEKAELENINCYSYFTHSLQLVCLK